jgi:hypothetical protein
MAIRDATKAVLVNDFMRLLLIATTGKASMSEVMLNFWVHVNWTCVLNATTRLT